MRICFVSGETLLSFRESEMGEKADIFLFGFNGMGEVDYERELQGETNYFERAALLSKNTKSVVVCGCITNTRGHKRKSAVIAENGRLKGVSDMLHVIDEEVGSGASLRIYETGQGRMGVSVAEDLHFPEVVKALADCGSDFIVCPYAQVYNGLPSVLLRANAYCFGTPIFLCGAGYAMIANSAGELVFASPQKRCVAEFENKTEYHLVQVRRRGIYNPCG